MFTVRHRQIVVTGAASGIGLATAKVLRAAGARVIGLDTRIVAEPSIPSRSVDLTVESAVTAGMAWAAQQLGGITALVNCAGILREAPLGSTRVEDFDLLYAVNVRGTFLAAREALRFMPDAGDDSACIINVASELGFSGRGGASAYAATKGAIVTLTRSWASELGPRVLVNAVAPGPVDTPMLQFAGMGQDQQAVETNNPLRRIGQPAEIAKVILFLCSDGATFVTGQVYSADGGAAPH